MTAFESQHNGEILHIEDVVHAVLSLVCRQLDRVGEMRLKEVIDPAKEASISR